MHTLVSKLVALSVEKYRVALTEIPLQICRFHGSLSQKGSRPLSIAKLRNAKNFSVFPTIVRHNYNSTLRAFLQANSDISLSNFCFRNSSLSILISDK